jgi:hypothetical protein
MDGYPVSASMMELLEWVSARQRTYAEAMEAWRSTCPRHSTWEDALIDELIEVVDHAEVVLTPAGRAALNFRAADP